ncbi:MAG: NosD domain-containing protein, partial [Candidatus Micrarchaeota archaeon]
MVGGFSVRLALFAFLMVLAANFVDAGTGCNAAHPSCGQIPTNDCDVRENTTFQMGYYYLPAGIDVCANDVILDCGNSLLSGDYSGTYAGISLPYTKNATVKNCEAFGYLYGSVLSYADSNYYVNNRFYRNSYGIMVHYSNFNVFSRINASNNAIDGVYLTISNNNLIAESVASSNNDHGIFPQNSYYNTITKNTVKYNAVSGIHGHIISHNIFSDNIAENNL